MGIEQRKNQSCRSIVCTTAAGVYHIHTVLGNLIVYLVHKCMSIYIIGKYLLVFGKVIILEIFLSEEKQKIQLNVAAFTLISFYILALARHLYFKNF